MNFDGKVAIYYNDLKGNELKINEKEKQLACEFAKESNLKVGFQRIDFLRLQNDDLILLEIEDNSPHMNLEELSGTSRKNVLDKFKKNIYQHIKNKDKLTGCCQEGQVHYITN